MASPKTTAHRSTPAASRLTETPVLSPDDLVPFSTHIPQQVRDHLVKAAGVGTGAAMGRKVLTDWSEANKATR